MFVTALAATALLATQDATPKITAVSMFKNGYSFVAHETPIGGSGEYIIEQPPQAAHGTFWHLPTAGIAITRATATDMEIPYTSPAGNLDVLLELNVGKRLTVDFMDLPSITGTLMTGIGDQLVVKTNEGVVLVSKNRIKRVLFAQEPIFKSDHKASKRVLKLQVEAKGPGSISTVGLERGLAWVPAYAIDISDKKELQLVAKATVINELADLDDVDASFITGFPNVRYAGTTDPLVSTASLDQMLGMLVAGSFAKDISAGNVMTQNAPAARDAEMVVPSDFTGGYTTGGEGQQLEDLFFYKLSGITLKKGDRAAYTLFTTKVPYEHLYTWDVVRQPDYNPDRERREDQPQDVWHSLTFKNNSGKPFTTAVATTFQNGQILGQDIMHYTTPGTDAEVRITKSLDIHAEALEEEVSRERAALKLPSGNTYDLITVKGTLTARNNRKEASKMRISVSFSGDLATSDHDPKVVKGAKGLGDLNPVTFLEWRPEIRSGEQVQLTYTYKVYARTP